MADKMMRIAGRDQNGLAKAVSTDKYGKLQVQADFIGVEIAEKMVDAGTISFTGKTKGNNSVNPHSAYIRNNITLPATKSDFKVTEIGDSAYGQIAIMDGVSLGTGATVLNQYGQQTFVLDVFKHLINSGYLQPDSTIDDMNRELQSLTINWKGAGSSASGNSALLKYYNDETQSLSLLGTVVGTGLNLVNASIIKPVLSDGFLYLVAHSSGTSNGTVNSAIFTDVITVNVELLQYDRKIPTKDDGVINKLSEVSTILEDIRDKPSTGGGSTLEITNIDDNSKAELTAIKDGEGRSVLRVVDAAPFAYNPITDSLKVEGIESQKGTFIETLVTNKTIAPSGEEIISVSFTTESEIWFAVSFNKPSWLLQLGSLFAKESGLSRTLYPKRDNEVNSYTDTAPAVSLFIPIPPSVDISNLQDARNYVLSPGENTYRLRFLNKHIESGNLTIKLIRVWR